VKYLSTYRLFESVLTDDDLDEVKTEVNDLLSNIIDDGFKVDTYCSLVKCSPNVVTISIYRDVDKNTQYESPRSNTEWFQEKEKRFKWSGVRPEIVRMMDFLKDRFILESIKIWRINEDGKSRSFSFTKIPSEDELQTIKFIEIKSMKVK